MGQYQNCCDYWKKIVEPGDNHSPEQILWTTIMRDQRDNIGGTEIYYTLKCVGGQRGSTLALTYSGEQIRHL